MVTALKNKNYVSLIGIRRIINNGHPCMTQFIQKENFQNQVQLWDLNLFSRVYWVWEHTTEIIWENENLDGLNFICQLLFESLALSTSFCVDVMRTCNSMNLGACKYR